MKAQEIMNAIKDGMIVVDVDNIRTITISFKSINFHFNDGSILSTFSHDLKPLDHNAREVRKVRKV